MARFDHLIDDRPCDGVFSVSRELFRDPALFELEMKYVFGRTWLFVGLESQIPNPNDYFTTMIGRTPIVVARGADAVLRCFVNSCRHKGASVFNLAGGNQRNHTCPYHAWVYDTAGRCVSVNGEKSGAYPRAFAEQSHDMVAVPRFANYRGLLFASLAPDGLTLLEHLGQARIGIDLIVDQSPQGIELVPGRHAFTYNGNWKLQLENGSDAYHFVPTHISYINVLRQRDPGADGGTGSVYENMDAHRASLRGSFTFTGGHALLWGGNANESRRPLFESKDELLARVGETWTRYMLSLRNLTLFPNVQFAENASLQLRIIRPIAVDRTEVTAWCVAPKGESAQARIKRLRQYEDFFNLTGCATPDDVAAYEACQRGNSSEQVQWQQGYSRGLAAVVRGANAEARELGITPETSVTGDFGLGDETIYHAQYREWLRLMNEGAR